jgi:hypothetical protein
MTCLSNVVGGRKRGAAWLAGPSLLPEPYYHRVLLAGIAACMVMLGGEFAMSTWLASTSRNIASPLDCYRTDPGWNHAV